MSKKNTKKSHDEDVKNASALLRHPEVKKYVKIIDRIREYNEAEAELKNAEYEEDKHEKLKRAIAEHNQFELKIQQLEIEKAKRLATVEVCKNDLELFLMNNPDKKLTRNGITNKTRTDKVAEFHQLFDFPILRIGQVPTADLFIQRLSYLFEEVGELGVAMDKRNTLATLCLKMIASLFEGDSLSRAILIQDLQYDIDQSILNGDNPDMVEVADATGDISYLNCGNELSFGFIGCCERVFDAIHENNMQKAHTSHDHALETVNSKGYAVGSYSIGEKKIGEKTFFVLKNSIKKLTKPHDHTKVDLYPIMYGKPRAEKPADLQFVIVGNVGADPQPIGVFCDKDRSLQEAVKKALDLAGNGIPVDKWEIKLRGDGADFLTVLGEKPIREYEEQIMDRPIYLYVLDDSQPSVQ